MKLFQIIPSFAFLMFFASIVASPQSVIQAEGANSQMSAFDDLFEIKQISNLHLYTSNDQTEDFPYYGEPVPIAYAGFFPRNTAKLFRDTETVPRAVLSFVSGTERFYVMYLPLKDWSPELALFKWKKNDKLRKVQTLAYYQCRKRKCIQKNSWIRDVNGDTRLDIVRKKVYTRDGKEYKTRITVYLINRKGKFKKLNRKESDIYYQMERSENENYN